MRSDYYGGVVIDTRKEREAKGQKAYEAKRDAARKKYGDRGSAGAEEQRKAFKRADIEAYEDLRNIEKDEVKDLRLLEDYGKDAPKSKSFSTRREGGGIARDRRDGVAMGGRTRIPRVDDSKVLMEAGGYSGGLAESGRGTMAGEMGRKGSMSVREAGEDMFELSKRKRGMQGGGAASSYNRRYNNQNK